MSDTARLLRWHYLENVEGSAFKFYLVTLTRKGPGYETAADYGRIGSSRQRSSKYVGPDLAAATRAYDALVRSKIAGGYAERPIESRLSSFDLLREAGLRLEQLDPSFAPLLAAPRPALAPPDAAGLSNGRFRIETDPIAASPGDDLPAILASRTRVLLHVSRSGTRIHPVDRFEPVQVTGARLLDALAAVPDDTVIELLASTRNRYGLPVRWIADLPADWHGRDGRFSVVLRDVLRWGGEPVVDLPGQDRLQLRDEARSLVGIGADPVPAAPVPGAWAIDLAGNAVIDLVDGARAAAA